jgi:hypothetical protein
MRKLDFKKNHFEFEQWIIWYGNFLKRLIEARKVVKSKFEKMELVEALVLRCAVRWEVLVEDDIITSLNRDSSAYAESLGLRLRKHLTRDESEAMIIGHRYLDFKSVGDVKKFARRHLVSKYNPFETITPQIADKIDEFMIIRNLLAHYSGHGWRAYRRMMAQKYSYRRVPEPGAFLIKADPKTQEYRWSSYLINFLKCSERMRKAIL